MKVKAKEGWREREDPSIGIEEVFERARSSPMMLSEPGAAEGRVESKMERFAREMRNRTFAFALEIVDAMNVAPDSHSLKVIRHQLLRSATSVMANYRAVCRARSDREFFAKMSIVVEEADECVGWLGLLFKSETIKMDKAHIKTLLTESVELTKIFATARAKVRSRLNESKSPSRKR